MGGCPRAAVERAGAPPQNCLFHWVGMCEPPPWQVLRHSCKEAGRGAQRPRRAVHLEHVRVELLLQPLVGQVDAQLLKGVDVE